MALVISMLKLIGVRDLSHLVLSCSCRMGCNVYSPEFSVVNVKPFKRVIGVNGKKAWLSYMKKRLEVVATWKMHGR